MNPRPDAGGAIPRFDSDGVYVNSSGERNQVEPDPTVGPGRWRTFGVCCPRTFPEVPWVGCECWDCSELRTFREHLEYRHQLTDADAALRSVQQELNQAVVEGDMARRERNRFEAELRALRAQLQEQNVRYEQTKGSLVSQLRGAERRAGTAEAKLAEADAALRSCQQELADARLAGYEAAESLKHLLSEARAERDRLQEANDDLHLVAQGAIHYGGCVPESLCLRCRLEVERDRIAQQLDLANQVERHSRQQKEAAEADLSTARAERDRLQQELGNARSVIWTCGCGWMNGVNLSVCASCGRNPVDGLGVEFAQDIENLRGVIKQAEAERDAARARVQQLLKYVRHQIGCNTGFGVCEWRTEDKELCNCGLAALLGADPSQEPLPQKE